MESRDERADPGDLRWAWEQYCEALRADPSGTIDARWLAGYLAGERDGLTRATAAAGLAGEQVARLEVMVRRLRQALEEPTRAVPAADRAEGSGL